MRNRSFRSLTPIVFLAVLVLLALMFFRQSGGEASHTLTLIAPPFVQMVHAEEDSILAGIVDEAGISGYYQTAGAITINTSLRNAFRTIEIEMSDYIIGSVALPGYPESYDVHVYAHKDGWIMAYYLKADPAGKIFDWNQYATSNKTAIQTTLENAAAIVAGAAGKPYTGLTYYDFRYPNANQMMLIAEDGVNDRSFTVQLPTNFTYYERSWSVKNVTMGGMYLNGVKVVGSDGHSALGSGYLAASQLLPGETHTFALDNSYGVNDFGGLLLIYQVP